MNLFAHYSDAEREAVLKARERVEAVARGGTGRRCGGRSSL